MSSRVTPEGHPSGTAFRPLTPKSKSWVWHRYAGGYGFIFFSPQDETKLPICFCLFGLIPGNLQCTPSKQATTPVATEHLPRLVSLGPGYPAVTSEEGQKCAVAGLRWVHALKGPEHLDVSGEGKEERQVMGFIIYGHY